MKFSTREDIELPIQTVFDSLSQFESFEQAARRRGATVTPKPRAPSIGLGAAWNVRFPLRGKEREMAFEVVRFEAPRIIRVTMNSRNLTGELDCELIALARSRTRIILSVDVRPLTLKARLLIQSLRLTKPKLTRKYKERVGLLVSNIEKDCIRQD